ncbi:8356_t:CDS:1 [Entrophospora sp. SA101]|nr:8356_t:CDS:1 [Entrophospora sp. SA101]
MSGFDITIIIHGDKKGQLPKPFNNRPGYDMKYVMAIFNKYDYYNSERIKNIFEIEKLYDNLSIVKQGESFIKWALRVRINLQDLLSENKLGMYHRYCLFASYPGGRLEDYNNYQNYYRPKPLKNGTAICFGCWKIFRVNVNIKPKKIFDRRRCIEIIKTRDLMLDHWDHECAKPKTDFGCARIIQRAWRNFKKRPESLAAKVWNAVKGDIIPDEEKFLGITTRKVKNLQTRDQFNLWRNNILAEYEKEKNFNMFSFYYRLEYEEYSIPDDWISFKKHQLRQRLRKSC